MHTFLIFKMENMQWSITNAKVILTDGADTILFTTDVKSPNYGEEYVTMKTILVSGTAIKMMQNEWPSLPYTLIDATTQNGE